MEENRLKKMQAMANKVAKIVEELDIFIDAQLYQASINGGAGEGVVAQLKIASDNLKKATYSFALAEASADADCYIDQMKMNIEKIGEAQ
jgi:hypothetical protein